MSEERLTFKLNIAEIDMIDIFDENDIDYGIDTFVKFVKDKVAIDQKTYPNAQYSFFVDFPYQGYPEFHIMRKWEETDEEYDARINFKESQEKKNKEIRYKKYLMLKQEFEPE